MKRRAWIVLVAGGTIVLGADRRTMRVVLDPENPKNSRGDFGDTSFPVGFGKHGCKPAGTSFEGGYSLLGTFRVNAILTKTDFAMTGELVARSGKSREWLANNLFTNMSSIDFDGDGKGGEYGDAFIGLEPIGSSAKQPFHFGEYKGVFRWYSYAIHGTQDETRIGKCITGGCINVGRNDLAVLVKNLKLGDLVEITRPD